MVGMFMSDKDTRNIVYCKINEVQAFFNAAQRYPGVDQNVRISVGDNRAITRRRTRQRTYFHSLLQKEKDK